jgi:hypothetical protein
MGKDKDPRAEDGKKKSSNGGGARWQEQNGGESVGGKDGGTTKVKTAVFPPLRFISRGRALRGARPARINCRESFPR